MSRHCREAEHLKPLRQGSPAQGGTESSPTPCERIPSENKHLNLLYMFERAFVVPTSLSSKCYINKPKIPSYLTLFLICYIHEKMCVRVIINSNTLRVRSAVGKEIGLRLMPGCRWLERSMGIL